MIAVGVDTHKHEHLAGAVDGLGQILGGLTIRADLSGYIELLQWLGGLGEDIVVGIEGAGSYGSLKGKDVKRTWREKRRFRRLSNRPSGHHKTRPRAGIFRDGETQTRTGDTTIFSRVLYQLSYLAESPANQPILRLPRGGQNGFWAHFWAHPWPQAVPLAHFWAHPSPTFSAPESSIQLPARTSPQAYPQGILVDRPRARRTLVPRRSTERLARGLRAVCGPARQQPVVEAPWLATSTAVSFSVVCSTN
jgi:hypothetical protein